MWSFPLHVKFGSTSCLGGHLSVKDHEGLWLHLTCELMRQMLLTVSWMLAEDMISRVRDKGRCISQSSEWGRGSVFLTSLSPSSQGDRERLGDTYLCSHLPTEEKPDPGGWNLLKWAGSVPALCSGGSAYLCLLAQFTAQTSLQR